MTLAQETTRIARHGAAAPATSRVADRVAFVDYAKGICIILVVMMHSTLGVGEAMGGEGWMHYFVAFARPFRMPDFFLIAGLFLSRTIETPWRRYVDRKVLHFVYFYVLWALIQLVVKIGGLADLSVGGFAKALAMATVEPVSTLWFIYLLPIFFIVTRLTRNVPWPIMIAAGVLLESARVTGYGTVIDEFASRYVYFYAGYRFAPLVFAFAARIAARPGLALAGLGLWALANAAAVFSVAWQGAPLASLQGFSLVFGLAGALALLSTATLLAKFSLLEPLRWLGERSLIVYLAFFLFMAATRIALVRSGLIGDIGLVSIIVTSAGIVGPLALAAAVRSTPLKYLFARPAWARLEKAS